MSLLPSAANNRVLPAQGPFKNILLQFNIKTQDATSHKIDVDTVVIGLWSDGFHFITDKRDKETWELDKSDRPLCGELTNVTKIFLSANNLSKHELEIISVSALQKLSQLVIPLTIAVCFIIS